VAAHALLAHSAGNGLALAIISSSTEPLLLLDQNLLIVAASASFCQAFGIEPIGLSGQPITALGSGEWNVAQLVSLLRATASGSARVHGYEMDLRTPGDNTRLLVVNAERLEFGEPEAQLVLMAVADVTDQRLAVKVRDDLVREKAVMLRELQHRVANSLQIIASVLLQSARRVQSEETKGHLHNAHHRVMSVAAVQRQLATTGEPDVALDVYFTELCASIAASMIHDPELLTLSVSVDGSTTDSDTSVSLGLIITELAINALKHGFPEGRAGTIKVAYRSRGNSWSMSVTDDGVGMPAAGADKPGLGTSIVRALATQLKADIRVVAMSPGTAVLIERKELGVEPPGAAAV
jgi:two-component sensor histidine kinase